MYLQYKESNYKSTSCYFYEAINIEKNIQIERKGGVCINIKGGKIKRFLIALLVIFLLSMSTLIVHATVNDITGHWAQEVIQKWLDKKLASGYTDGTFRPNNPITRAEFMILVNNVFGFTNEKDIAFTDVNEGQWFYDTVRKAVAAGYIEGYSDGSLKPNNSITREEVATIIAKIMKLELNSSKTEIFADKEKINWSKGYIGAVVNKGLMKGYPDGTFRPQNNITRAEALYALNNIMKVGESEGIKVIAKQDLFGITYMHVIVDEKIKPIEVRADEQVLEYDVKDGRWKGTRLDLEIGDIIQILIKGESGEERLFISIKAMEED